MTAHDATKGVRPRVAIVGANATRAWAHDAHVPALRELSHRLQLEAVSARTQPLADQARAAFGARRAFGDSLAMARDPQVDIVTVTVKVPEHHAIVLEALRAGKHVYCEWPLGRTLAEAKEMAAAVAPATNVMIGLQALSSPAVIDARHLVQGGALGTLKRARIVSPTAGWGTQAPPHYAYLQERQNGATLEAIAGGHTLALCEFLMGPYLEIDARNSTLCKRVRIGDTEQYVERTSADHMAVFGLHESGCVSVMEIMGGAPGHAFELELEGARGSLRLTSRHPGGYQVGRLALETKLVLEDPTPDPSLGLEGGPVNVLHAYARFADDLQHGRRSFPDFEYAVHLTHLLEAIDRASASGVRQRVDSLGGGGLTHDVTDAVRRAERARCAAMLRCDLAALEDLLDARLSFAHSSGALDGRQAYMAKMAARRIQYLAIEWREERVLALSDTMALLTGCMLSRVEVDGVEKALDNRVTATWVFQESKWRMLAFQSTPLRT